MATRVGLLPSLVLIGALGLSDVAHAGGIQMCFGGYARAYLTLDGKWVLLDPDGSWDEPWEVEAALDLETGKMRRSRPTSAGRLIRAGVMTLSPISTAELSRPFDPPKRSGTKRTRWMTYAVPGAGWAVSVRYGCEVDEMDGDRTVYTGRYRYAPLTALRADALVRVALSHHAAQRWEKAAAAYLAALKQEPTHPPAIYNLACARARQGRSEEALAGLETALQRWPGLRSSAKRDKDLATLRDLPRFKALTAGAKGRRLKTSKIPRDHGPRPPVKPLATGPVPSLRDVLQPAGPSRYTYDPKLFRKHVPTRAHFFRHAALSYLAGGTMKGKDGFKAYTVAPDGFWATIGHKKGFRLVRGDVPWLALTKGEQVTVATRIPARKIVLIPRE